MEIYDARMVSLVDICIGGLTFIFPLVVLTSRYHLRAATAQKTQQLLWLLCFVFSKGDEQNHIRYTQIPMKWINVSIEEKRKCSQCIFGHHFPKELTETSCNMSWQRKIKKHARKCGSMHLSEDVHFKESPKRNSESSQDRYDKAGLRHF